MHRAVPALLLAFVATIGSLLGFVAGAGRSRAQQAPGPLSAWPSFAAIAERVNPAVVHIAVADGTGPSLQSELNQLPGWEGPRRGEGSGFVFDSQGYVVTNHHVIASSSRIRVRFA